MKFPSLQDYDDFDVANEDDELEEFLGIPRKTPKVRFSSSAVVRRDRISCEHRASQLVPHIRLDRLRFSECCRPYRQSPRTRRKARERRWVKGQMFSASVLF